MAVNEVSGFLKYKDSAGNVNLLFPITTKDNVDGLDELENELANAVKVTEQSLTDEQKAQARENIGAHAALGYTPPTAEYVDTAVSQKSQVQIITWEDDD